MIKTMTVNEYIALLQALPENVKALPAYHWDVTELRPVIAPVGEIREAYPPRSTDLIPIKVAMVV